jgi:hypothetical protein
MLSALMQVLDRLGGTSLNRIAENVHLLTLAILGVFWMTPVLAAIFRRWTRDRPVLWIRFWACPVCGQLNRRSFVKCQHCERVRPFRWRDTWAASSSAERLRRAARRSASMSRGLGWLLFGGVPAGAVCAFRLYSFHQNPLREILGSAALLLLLLVLYFFRAARRCGWRSPIEGLIHLLVGGALAGLFLAAGFLWAAAPYPPGKPFALVQVFPDGRIRWADSMGRHTTVTGGAQPNQVLFHVRYAVFSWPLFQADQTFVTHVEGIPVTELWTVALLKCGALVLSKDDPGRPRVVVLEQLLLAVPGRAYELYSPASKIGLALRTHPSPPPERPPRR